MIILFQTSVSINKIKLNLIAWNLHNNYRVHKVPVLGDGLPFTNGGRFAVVQFLYSTTFVFLKLQNKPRLFFIKLKSTKI